jgi:hypothetical protein
MLLLQLVDDSLCVLRACMSTTYSLAAAAAAATQCGNLKKKGCCCMGCHVCVHVLQQILEMVII